MMSLITVLQVFTCVNLLHKTNLPILENVSSHQVPTHKKYSPSDHDIPNNELFVLKFWQEELFKKNIV